MQDGADFKVADRQAFTLILAEVTMSVPPGQFQLPATPPAAIGKRFASVYPMRELEVSAYHAWLVPDGSRWRLAAEAGSHVWVAGERITNVALTGPVTALLGTRGEAAIRLEPTVAQQWATQLASARPAPVQATGPAWSGQTITGQVSKGFDLALLVALPDGTAVTVPTGGLPRATAGGASGCFPSSWLHHSSGWPLCQAGPITFSFTAGRT